MTLAPQSASSGNSFGGLWPCSQLLMTLPIWIRVLTTSIIFDAMPVANDKITLAPHTFACRTICSHFVSTTVSTPLAPSTTVTIASSHPSTSLSVNLLKLIANRPTSPATAANGTASSHSPLISAPITPIAAPITLIIAPIDVRNKPIPTTSGPTTAAIAASASTTLTIPGCCWVNAIMFAIMGSIAWINLFRMGSRTSPMAMASAWTDATIIFHWNSVDCCTVWNALSRAPTPSLISARFSAYNSAAPPVRNMAALRPGRRPINSDRATPASSNSLARNCSVAPKPCSANIAVIDSVVCPIAASAAFDFPVSFTNDAMILVMAVTPSDAVPPAAVNVPMNAVTSAIDTDRFDAIPSRRPRGSTSSSASEAPRWTAATKTSVISVTSFS